MTILKKYRQLKELPFQKEGSIWEIVYNTEYIVDVIVNGCVYTDTVAGHGDTRLWMGLVEYFYMDGKLEMDLEDRNGEKWFEDITEVDPKEAVEERLNKLNHEYATQSDIQKRADLAKEIISLEITLKTL